MEQLKAQLHSTSRARSLPDSRKGSKVGRFVVKWMEGGWRYRQGTLTVLFHKEDMLDEGMGGKKSAFSAEELDDEELSRMEGCRPVRPCAHTFGVSFDNTSRHAAFVTFCQKTTKPKSLIPPPRKQKVGDNRSDPVFSPRTPQRTPGVCLCRRFYRRRMQTAVAERLVCVFAGNLCRC